MHLSFKDRQENQSKGTTTLIILLVNGRNPTREEKLSKMPLADTWCWSIEDGSYQW